MKNSSLLKLSLLTLSAFLIFGCSKKNDSGTTPPPEVKEPLRVEKKIFRHMNGSDLIVDSFSYKYDNGGRVISKTWLDGISREEYEYSGDQLVSVTTGGDTGRVKSINFAHYSDNGDTILLDYSRPDQTQAGYDSVQLTYVYKDSQIVSRWVYVHLYAFPPSFEKYNFIYNADGNITSLIYENVLYPNSSNTSTITSWDDKINPKNHQPLLNYFLLDLNLPVESNSAHNPVKYSGISGGFEFDMTYNEEGYPLTVKSKNENFIRTELIYNR